MESRRPGFSITLPRNFAPLGLHSLDNPRTPDQTFAEASLPPPPHHSTQRIRRPRLNFANAIGRNNALPALFASDIPVPSIEVNKLDDVFAPIFPSRPTEPSPSTRLAVPSYRDEQPKTPEAQTQINPLDAAPKPSVWGLERPLSATSMRSDSSLSSRSSSISRSFGGSCTSPDSDFQDPFGPRMDRRIPDTPVKPKFIKAYSYESPAITKIRWTIEMDNHLWNVYQMYLADPTITPFKNVPGSLPPLGVCHRVARKAKETWPRATLVPHPMVEGHIFRDVMDERWAFREFTPQQQFFDGPTDATPKLLSTPAELRHAWPKESATRRRLKELCKQKFSITPHYNRLRESRSPSPFTEQFQRRPSSRQESENRECASYATRELGISLASTGTTGKLAQLVTGDSPMLDPPASSDEFFNTRMAASSPPSIASQGLGIDTQGLIAPTEVPRLASPFAYNTWSGRAHGHRKARSSLGRFDTMHATGRRLLPPVDLELFANVSKRRAQASSDEQTPVQRESALPQHELIFSGNGDVSHRRIKLRTRGSTMGAASGKEKLHRLFTPPGVNDSPIPLLPPVVPSSAGSSRAVPPFTAGLSVPQVEETNKRLGSPFELDPNKRSNRTKPPRHIPSLSDPFVSNPFSTQSNTQSIGERLAAFAAMQDHKSPNLFNQP